MYWFRNAIIYQLTKKIDFESIEKQLKECEFTPCGSADVSHFGWSAPLVTRENLAHQADGKILLVAKREEKILPIEVVNRELNKRITALEEKEQRKLKKVERLSLKDDVIATLLPQAFSRIKTTALYIDTLKQLIFVDAASSKTAEDALALLRKSLGSLPVVPLAFNRAPCEVMTRWVQIPRQIGSSCAKNWRFEKKKILELSTVSKKILKTRKLSSLRKMAQYQNSRLSGKTTLNLSWLKTVR